MKTLCFGWQRHIFKTNFSIDYFGIYDRIDVAHNETDRQIAQELVVAIATS